MNLGSVLTNTSLWEAFLLRQRWEMPLKKSASKSAFKSNIKAEVHAGKPVKQAVAIAYSEKRAAKKGKHR